MKNGATIKGTFSNNYPEGECTISYSDGSVYFGNLVKGIPNGEGTLTKHGFVYKGHFRDGLRSGEG